MLVPRLGDLEAANVRSDGEHPTCCTHSDTLSWRSFLFALPLVVDFATEARLSWLSG
jgi:hypothetical protein